ncbi:MAG: GlxA family transcriptional regulator [Phenylobacterium sp.]|nr:MAG: GlxA family transcriptional regulator [Phenylobacterium sp.]
MTRRIAFVIYPGFQLLDATGPIAAFDIAARYQPGAYSIEVVAAGGGQVMSTAGVAVMAADLPAGPFDTLVVSGGEGSRDFAALAGLLEWLKGQARTARRIASVCTGAYVLAEAGLLEGRRATTHWAHTEHFGGRYPGVRLEADRIFIRQDEVWTSAGITAGIDLALALIEDDLGAQMARRTAQQLVMHHRRPGGQSQFSALLDSGGVHGRFAELMDWIRERLGEPLNVEQLADEAAMSPRHFARAFRAETGLTPAKAVERLRLEAARLRVETSGEPIDRVAEAVGFGDPERMRRAFLRTFGQPPQAIRRAARV